MDEAFALYEEGRRRMARGDLAGAIASFERSEALSTHFKTLELLGECLLRLGRFAEAVAPLTAATNMNGQSRAPALLAEALHALGEVDKARSSASEALRRSPGNRRARAILAKTGEPQDHLS